jgi:hypothetical protein
MLGLFRYQTFSAADYARFRRMYNVNKRETAIWSIDDYTKPGLERSGAIAAWWLPQLRGVWRRVDAEATCFVAILDLPPEASEQYGCPPEVTIDMRIAHTEAPIELAVQWLTKPACRMPEALWCSFNPIAPDAGGWSMDKQGQQVKPGDVIRHGNRRLHAVGGGVHYRDARGQLELTTLDAPLVAPGEPSLLNFTTRQPPLQHGMHVNLFNNLWGTNFPMWFDEPARFRFKIALG